MTVNAPPVGFWTQERINYKEQHNLGPEQDIGAPLLTVMTNCNCSYCTRRVAELADEGLSIETIPASDPRRNFKPRLKPDSTRKFRVKGAAKPENVRVRWNRNRDADLTVSETSVVSEDEVFRTGLEVEALRSEVRRTEHLLNIVIGDAQRKDLQTKLTELYYDLGQETAKFERLQALWEHQQAEARWMQENYG